MAIQKAKLSQKKATWQQQFKAPELKGKTLNPSAAIQEQFQKELEKLTSQMTREVTKELRALFRSPAAQTLDAAEEKLLEKNGRPIATAAATGSIASQSRILINKLINRFTRLFNDRAQTLAERMVERTLKNSALTLKASLKVATGQSISTDFMTKTLSEVTKASVESATGLIKRIPAEYMSKVQNAVMRSITTTEGSGALMKELGKYNHEIKNWAFNTARDQTTKAYNNINRERMIAVGVEEFEWVHSGGGSNPREYHKHFLNGKVFRFDDPPVIDLRTKEKGFPGQLPNCRCKQRPILRFNES